MKRLLTCFTACLLNLVNLAADIYIAPTGADTNPGTQSQPMATLSMALRKSRELRRLNDPSIVNGIHIILRGGTYTLYEPIFIRPEDAGTSTSPTYIHAAPGEKPVISGGIQITGWSLAKTTIGIPAIAKGKVWVASIPPGNNAINFRQLWINDSKAVRARDRNGDSMSRIRSWNHKTEECWIPTPAIRGIENIQGLEFFIHQWWAVATLRVKQATVYGDSTRLSFFQPESKLQSEHPWPAPWQSKETGNSAFYLANALQFLDTPGEWWLDRINNKVYYWPRANENMVTANIIAPVIETLINIEGTPDAPVSNITVSGISFEHTGWLRPSEKGHVALQAGMYLLDAYKLKIPGTPDKKGLENQAWIGRQPAAITVNFSHHINFEQCTFKHLAATGLDLVKGTHHNRIFGNLFTDIGGTAIQAGIFSDPSVETHLPYDPADEREVCRNEYIGNNLITDVTNEDWGCVGISAGYVRDILIEHNEVNEVSYSGICVGWGWTKTVNAMRNNRVYANKVHHYAKHMYDVGGLYTLSSMPNSMIHENYIDSIYKAPYAHDPKHWFYYYLDEGSSGITIRDNWSPSDKVMRNQNGPGNSWENNGPQVADSIKRNAGIQPAYRYLLAEHPWKSKGWPVNY